VTVRVLLVEDVPELRAVAGLIRAPAAADEACRPARAT
jgi:hypothetical protein